jgi:hypothetical protein
MQNESAKNAFNLMIDKFGENVPYKIMEIISRDTELFIVCTLFCGELFISADTALKNPAENKILVYIKDIELYVMATCAEYKNLKTRLSDRELLVFVPYASGIRSIIGIDRTNEVNRITEYFGFDNVFTMGSYHIVIGSKASLYAFAEENTDIMVKTKADPIVYVRGVKYIPIHLSAAFTDGNFSLLAINYVPAFELNIYTGIDIQSYIGKYCLYFLQMNVPNTDCYKYGISGHIIDRLNTHRRAINYLKIIKIFVMVSEEAMKNAEKEYKKLSKDRGIDVVRLKYTEVVQTNDLEAELKVLEEVVNTHNAVAQNAIPILEDNIENIEDCSVDEDKTQNLCVEKIDIKTITINWIKQHPPREREKRTEYYEIYKVDIGKLSMPENVFATIVPLACRCKKLKSNGSTYWTYKM